MKKIFNFLLITIITILGISLTSCDNSNTLYVGTSPDYAPYEFVDSTRKGDAKYVGADIELAKHIAKELGMKLKLQPMEFDSILSSIQTSKVDVGISGFTYQKERAGNFEFSVTYQKDGEGYQCLLIKESNASKYTTLESLNNKDVKVGAQSGSTPEGFVKAKLANATYQAYTTIDEGIQYLLSGKIDAFAIASTVAEGIKTANPNLREVAEKLDEEDSSLYVIGKKGNTELMSKIDTIITKVVNDGLYDKWVKEAKILLEVLGDKAHEGLK